MEGSLPLRCQLLLLTGVLGRLLWLGGFWRGLAFLQSLHSLHQRLHKISDPVAKNRANLLNSHVTVQSSKNKDCVETKNYAAWVTVPLTVSLPPGRIAPTKHVAAPVIVNEMSTAPVLLVKQRIVLSAETSMILPFDPAAIV